MRREELGEAVWRVILRDGVAEVSIRTVAAEAGWSAGALRHYLPTRAELLAFACELVIDRVTARIRRMHHTAGPRRAAADILLETMPVDQIRHTEASIAFAFLTLGLGNPELVRVQRRQFTGMYELCLNLVQVLSAERVLADPHPALETLARRLHAVVDGLTVHVLVGHLSVAEMIAQLNTYLDELTGACGISGTADQRES